MTKLLIAALFPVIAVTKWYLIVLSLGSQDKGGKITTLGRGVTLMFL